MKITGFDQPIPEVAEQLATNIDLGLSTGEASKRLAQLGPNELRKGKGISPLALSVGQ
jgi:hypothetical protein